MIWVWRKKEHFSFTTQVFSLSYRMNFGPRLGIVGWRRVFTHGTECAGAGFRRTCRKDFLQKFCNFVFGARLHHRQLRNITFSSNFGTATRQNSFLNWKGTTVDESVSQGSVQNYRKHFKLLTYQKQKTLISRYCRSLRRTRANLGICFWVGKIIPNAWEPNTFWEFDSQYATVGEHLCRGYCLFFHCHCRPQPTFELTSLHRVSFQPAIMWWKDCRALHKTFVLMKNIVSHFFTFSNWKFLTEKTISTQIRVLVQTLLENSYLIVRTLYHDLRLVVILISYYQILNLHLRCRQFVW